MSRVTALFPAYLLIAMAPAAAYSQAVPVVVVVSLPSQQATAAQVSGLELSITPLSGGASILATTDSSGQAAVRLSPGRYRIRSLNPARRDGAEYSWDVEATIRSLDKSVAITLNRQNANPVASAVLPPGTTVINPTSSQPSQIPIARDPTSLGPTDRGYRDPNMALLFGLLFTGGGHIYSGEIGKGVGILLGSATLVGAAISFCNYNSCEESYAAAALVGALGLIVYSWVDAPAAAKRTNSKGIRQITLGPVQLRPGANGLAFFVHLP